MPGEAKPGLADKTQMRGTLGEEVCPVGGLFQRKSRAD